MYNVSKFVVIVIYSTQEEQALPLEPAMEVSENLGEETTMDTWSQDYYSSTQISETTASPLLSLLPQPNAYGKTGSTPVSYTDPSLFLA